MDDKDRIDYEIEAKRKAKNKELKEWNIALFIVLMITGALALILNTL